MKGIAEPYRYYGKSVPVESLSTDDLRFLNNAEALEDSAYVRDLISKRQSAYTSSSSRISSRLKTCFLWSRATPSTPPTHPGSIMVDRTLELEQLICGPSTLISCGAQSLLLVHPYFSSLRSDLLTNSCDPRASQFPPISRCNHQIRS